MSRRRLPGKDMNNPWLFRFSLVVAVVFLALLAAGAVLTDRFATGAAPTSSSLEFVAHRHAAEAVTVLVLILAIWVTGARGGLSRSLATRLCWCAVAATILEVLSGTAGIPLSEGLAFSHAFLAQLVFGIVVAVPVLLWPGWGRESVPLADKGWPSLRSLSRTTVILIVIQIVLGAAFRHNLAGVLWHILGAFLVVLFGVGLMVLLTQTEGGQPLRPAVITLGILLGVQVTLGMVLISIGDRSQHPALVLYSTVAHVLTGAATFAVTILTAMLIRRAVRNTMEKAA